MDPPLLSEAGARFAAGIHRVWSGIYFDDDGSWMIDGRLGEHAWPDGGMNGSVGALHVIQPVETGHGTTLPKTKKDFKSNGDVFLFPWKMANPISETFSFLCSQARAAWTSFSKREMDPRWGLRPRIVIKGEIFSVPGIFSAQARLQGT